jgi:hypothetical protein
MDNFINLLKFMQQMFDEKPQAKRAAEIRQTILKAQSLRFTDKAAKLKPRTVVLCDSSGSSPSKSHSRLLQIHESAKDVSGFEKAMRTAPLGEK